jgi:hypothetical protein
MLTRRAFVVSAAASLIAAPALAALPVPATRALAFRIVRKGSEIGSHRLEFQTRGDALTVSIDVEMLVKFGPIPVFRYSHRNLEHWQGGQFVSMEAKTNNDGDAAFASVRRDAGGLVVDGSKSGRYIAPANALAATHWNVAELSGPMINPENGAMLKPTVADKGVETIVAGGRPTKATRYSWRDDGAIDLWYDGEGVWTALAFHAKDGSTVNYERI